jgi:AraC-like DNA-binding protein
MKYGLTDEEMKDPYEAMFSGGVMKMWNARQAIVAQQMEEGDTIDDDVKYENEYEELGKDAAGARQKDREWRRRRAERLLEVPLWQQVSELFPETEEAMNPNERAGGILALIKKVEGMLRYEIKFAREHPMEFRTYLWDPLRVVCFHLGISQRRLTMYSRELTGMSAMEMVDRLKAEGVRGKLKEELRKFIRLTAEDAEDAEERMGDGADRIFAELKASRRDGRWHRTTWAMGLGFSSYQRFFRACLLCFGKTPHEVEMEIIEEILKEAERETESVTTGSAVAVRKGEEQREEKREAGVSVT